MLHWRLEVRSSERAIVVQVGTQANRDVVFVSTGARAEFAVNADPARIFLGSKDGEATVVIFVDILFLTEVQKPIGRSVRGQVVEIVGPSRIDNNCAVRLSDDNSS